ncbi:MAG: hypothetical protein C0504_11705 [Candidatus Solibacter sp.]|nr:hypothetical protein [Candidatus Solibacter sp.]
MALVEFSSEPAVQEVFLNLAMAGMPESEVERFPSTGDVERDVRMLVERLVPAASPVVWVRGLEDAFALGKDREKAIDLLNFLRETIAGAPCRQVWFVTANTGQLLSHRAPDWLSWFTLRLRLTSDAPAVEKPASEIQTDTVNLDSARAQAASAQERIARSVEAGIAPDEIWAGLAYPALESLRRAGAVAEELKWREEFLDRIFGSAHDAERQRKIRKSLNALIERGFYPAAAGLAGEGVEISLEGMEPRRQIAIWNEIGQARYLAGHYAEAEGLLEMARAQSELVLGPEHPDTLTSVNNLAGLFRSQGRYGEAEPLYVRALAARERVLGPEHPDTLTSVNNLAGLYRRQGRYGEAEPLYVRALAASERVLGPEHPSTLISVNNLAGLYESQGRYGEAEPLYVRALDGLERTLGIDHPNTRTVSANLQFLRERGRRTVDGAAHGADPAKEPVE